MVNVAWQSGTSWIVFPSGFKSLGLVAGFACCCLGGILCGLPFARFSADNALDLVPGGFVPQILATLRGNGYVCEFLATAGAHKHIPPGGNGLGRVGGCHLAGGAQHVLGPQGSVAGQSQRPRHVAHAQDKVVRACGRGQQIIVCTVAPTHSQ